MGLADGEDRRRSEKRLKNKMLKKDQKNYIKKCAIKNSKGRELTLQNIETNRRSSNHSFYKESKIFFSCIVKLNLGNGYFRGYQKIIIYNQVKSRN